MKRCPECRRAYFDDSLSYCLDDGAALLEGPSTVGERATAILPSIGSDTATKHFDAGRAPSPNHATLPPSRRRPRWVAVIIGLALLVAGAGVAYYKLRPTSVEHFKQIKITKLTTTGNVTHATVSPDGKQVVYVVDDGAKRTLWLRHIGTGSDVRLNAPENIFYWALTMSPDGSYLYYAYGGGGPALNRDLYQLPVLGGAPKKVIEGVNSPISFSPDGKRFAFVRKTDVDNMLITANADGTDERVLSVRKGPNTYGSLFGGGVSWSPDGTVVASIAQNYDEAGEFWNVVTVPATGGPERPITQRRWYEIQRLSWHSDGDGLLISAAEKQVGAEPLQIWYLPVDGSEPRKITNDLNRYASFSLSADSTVVVSVQTDMTSNIWTAPGGAEGPARQLTASATGAEGAFGLAWTHDEKLLYHSFASGAEDIWMMDADGNNRRNLTGDPTTDYHHSVSTDGRYIVFVSERAGNRNVWRMDIDGRNPIRLTTTPANNPRATSEWVVYQAQRTLWKVPINGGEPVRISAPGTVGAAISPDGKLIACSMESDARPRIAIISIDGGDPIKVFDTDHRLPALLRWSTDGKSITYVAKQNEASDIWSQPLEGGDPRKITDFKANRIFDFDWSRDNVLAISIGASISDVVLIKDVK